MSAQQNLVPNGSFEDTVHCPILGDLYNAKYFSNPTDASPDYFNICAPAMNNTSVPVNIGGYQVPRSGNGYGGIIAYGFGTNYREYIQTLLVNTLLKDKIYAIEYYTCLGNLASVACNNLGVLFSQTSISISTVNSIHSAYALSTKDIITDTLNWIKIRFLYKAKGNENYLIIGNFKDDNLTDTLTSYVGGNDVYYYIDDISVTEINFEIPNVFTPNSDGVNDTFYFDNSFLFGTELAIYNRWGMKVFQSNSKFIWDGKNIAGEFCNAGTYYYIISTETENYKGFFQLIR